MTIHASAHRMVLCLCLCLCLWSGCAASATSEDAGADSPAADSPASDSLGVDAGLERMQAAAARAAHPSEDTAPDGERDAGDSIAVGRPGSESARDAIAERLGPSTCSNRPPEHVPPDTGNWPAEELAKLIECDANEDCARQAHGYCATAPDSPVPSTRCMYGCETDEDCLEGAVCECGPEVGRCVPARCAGPEDCDGGRCLRLLDTSICEDGYLGAGVYYDCDGPDDECALDGECPEGEVCSTLGEDMLPTFLRRCQPRRLCGI